MPSIQGYKPTNFYRVIKSVNSTGHRNTTLVHAHTLIDCSPLLVTAIVGNEDYYRAIPVISEDILITKQLIKLGRLNK